MKKNSKRLKIQNGTNYGKELNKRKRFYKKYRYSMTVHMVNMHRVLMQLSRYKFPTHMSPAQMVLETDLESHGTKLFLPRIWDETDNAVMILAVNQAIADIYPYYEPTKEIQELLDLFKEVSLSK